MIHLEPHSEGVVLPIRALPGARKNEIRGQQEGALKVAVTQVAEKGKANKALISLLSKKLQVRRSQIQLMTGHSSPRKQLLIKGVSFDELSARITHLLAGLSEPPNRQVDRNL